MSYKLHKIISEEDRNMVGIGLLWTLALILGLVLGSASANAQMNNQQWGFKAQNRASIAALMRQVEDSDNTSNATVAAGYDSLVCGSDGQSSAKGNSTCIIMNNSDGAIQIGQDAQGNQAATNTEDTTVNSLSEALEDIEIN